MEVDEDALIDQHVDSRMEMEEARMAEQEGAINVQLPPAK
jgi:hypothetical protein